MSIYRLELKTVKRSAGRSATASAAYRAGADITDFRTGTRHDYSRRSGVEHAQVLAPDHAPAWARDRSALWNAAEKAERRKDATVARELTVALPHELTKAQRIEAARELGQWLVDRYGVAVDIACHQPDKDADRRNYHAHLLFTVRRMEPEGLASKKTRELDDRDQGPKETEAMREAWQHIGNRHLERAGHDPSLDRRSLKERGIDREPEPKQGPVATQIDRDGRKSHAAQARREVQARNAARAAAKAQVIQLQAERARAEERARKAARDQRKKDQQQRELERAELREAQAREKAQLLDREREALAQAKAEAKESFRPAWREVFRAQDRQRRDFAKAEKTIKGRLDNLKRYRDTGIDLFAGHKGRLGAVFATATSGEARKAALEASQKAERDKLGQQHDAALQDVQRAVRNDFTRQRQDMARRHNHRWQIMQERHREQELAAARAIKQEAERKRLAEERAARLLREAREAEQEILRRRAKEREKEKERKTPARPAPANLNRPPQERSQPPPQRQPERGFKPDWQRASTPPEQQPAPARSNDDRPWWERERGNWGKWAREFNKAERDHDREDDHDPGRSRERPPPGKGWKKFP